MTDLDYADIVRAQVALMGASIVITPTGKHRIYAPAGYGFRFTTSPVTLFYVEFDSWKFAHDQLAHDCIPAISFQDAFSRQLTDHLTAVKKNLKALTFKDP